MFTHTHKFLYKKIQLVFCYINNQRFAVPANEYYLQTKLLLQLKQSDFMF